jgi:hypothetical protein
MRAQRIIEGSSFGPDVLKVVRQAFDEAWQAVAHKFTADEHDRVREELATSMMSATRDDSSDVERLREAGIRGIRTKYASRFVGDSGQSSTGG